MKFFENKTKELAIILNNELIKLDDKLLDAGGLAFSPNNNFFAVTVFNENGWTLYLQNLEGNKIILQDKFDDILGFKFSNDGKKSKFLV